MWSPRALRRRHNPTRVCTATEVVARLAARVAWVAEKAAQVVKALMVVVMAAATVVAKMAAGWGEERAAGVARVAKVVVEWAVD